jgi:hypothetical protein
LKAIVAQDGKLRRRIVHQAPGWLAAAPADGDLDLLGSSPGAVACSAL